jgi:hypothetical protein
MGIDMFFEHEERRIITIDLKVGQFVRNPRAHFVITRRHFKEDKHSRIGQLIARQLLN